MSERSENRLWQAALITASVIGAIATLLTYCGLS